MLQEPLEEIPVGLDVTYDAVYSFPNSIAVDQITQIADDEITYSVENFVDDTDMARQ